MDLEHKDILQINATIIAGALVFLTVISFSSTIAIKSGGIVLALGIIVLFAQSSVFVLSGDRKGGLIAMRRATKYLMYMAILFMIWTLLVVVSPSFLSSLYHYLLKQ